LAKYNPEQRLFDRLMARLRGLVANEDGFPPVIPAALRC